MNTEMLILEKLEKIEKKVEDIRAHMVDVDTILTTEERRLLDQSIVDEKMGKFTRLEDMNHVRHRAR